MLEQVPSADQVIPWLAASKSAEPHTGRPGSAGVPRHRATGARDRGVVFKESTPHEATWDAPREVLANGSAPDRRTSGPPVSFATVSSADR